MSSVQGGRDRPGDHLQDLKASSALVSTLIAVLPNSSFGLHSSVLGSAQLRMGAELTSFPHPDRIIYPNFNSCCHLYLIQRSFLPFSTPDYLTTSIR